MKLAKSLDSMVTIKKADKEVDASRLLSLMGLGVRCNDEVMVRIEGGNEDAAYDDMKQYFEGIIEGIDDNYLGKYYRKEHICLLYTSPSPRDCS